MASDVNLTNLLRTPCFASSLLWIRVVRWVVVFCFCCLLYFPNVLLVSYRERPFTWIVCVILHSFYTEYLFLLYFLFVLLVSYRERPFTWIICVILHSFYTEYLFLLYFLFVLLVSYIRERPFTWIVCVVLHLFNSKYLSYSIR